MHKNISKLGINNVQQLWSGFGGESGSDSGFSCGYYLEECGSDGEEMGSGVCDFEKCGSDGEMGSGVCDVEEMGSGVCQEEECGRDGEDMGSGCDVEFLRDV